MTTCCRSSDIKSSVYNQTGEGFFQQLAAYNHMSAHLRRILLAKSRVDSRNPNYIQRQQRGRSCVTDKSLSKSISQDIIDRLAYDTEHHPIDILRMSYNDENHREKCSRSQDRSRRYNNTCNSSYTECPVSRINSATIRRLESERSRSMSRIRIHGSGPTFHSTRPDRSQRKSNNWRSRDEVDADGISLRHGGPISVNSSIRSSPRSSESKNENDPTCSNYASSFESSSEASRRGSPVPKLPASTPVESTLSTQRHQNTFEVTSTKFNKNDEEAKYSKFLYDITQEIVQCDFYSDEELQNVFKKHLQKNSRILDKDKMMYELHQLKLSLNIVDNEDEEENESIEQFQRNQKFSQDLTPKPPTPPKVLDENKLMDKLLSQDELREIYSKSTDNGRNTVVLIDANPELLISERDILATLVEMNIEPKQAQSVYKRLQKKSRDLNDTELVHPETVRRSNVQRARPERHEIQLTQRDVPYHRHYQMNTNRYYNTERNETISNRGFPSTVTLKIPCQEKHPSNPLDNYCDRTGKNHSKMCQCGVRMMEVRMPRCSDGYKTSTGRSSLKSKLSNEKKFVDVKASKDKKPIKLIDNQSTYIPTKINQEKTSLSQLGVLQSDKMRTERIEKNIDSRIEIKSFDHIQESASSKYQSFCNQNNEDIEIDHMHSSIKVKPTASTIKQENTQENITKLSDIIINNEKTETRNKFSADFNEIEETNNNQEYITNNPDESITESIDDDESIDGENSCQQIEKFKNEDTLESDIESKVERINDRVECDIDKITSGYYLTESQSQRNHSHKTSIDFLPCGIVTNTEIQVDINELTTEVRRICSCELIDSIGNREIDNESQWLEYLCDKNNNGLYDIYCSNVNHQTVINCVWDKCKNMVLCESCENIATYNRK